MATYPQAPPALTNSQFRPKWGSAGSSAVAFADAEVACVGVSTPPESRRSANFVSETQPPAWIKPSIQAFMELLQLPQDWDGYGAAQVREQIVQNALMVLVEVMENDAPTPSLVPLSDGGIQVEWHRRSGNLEIEFPVDEPPTFYYYDDEGGEETKGQINGNLDQIQAYIAKLK